ncbi:Wzz/FepE/Etk N-terminal domain-containing protein [Idiomarina sp.]|uniref:Wzz/FepE/Etk N-terminal domain-containing protein n=1 Tax=Idiomarina sp. TaxID=1874361 RepID=UPI002EA8796D|nr:Wzz/FepE/Etk N-terminal domain-containing protein [Pseudomonadota bacterium]
MVDKNNELKKQSNDMRAEEQEADLRDVLGMIWRGKWIVMFSAAVFAVLSVIVALSLPNIYQSEVTLAPTEEASGGGMAQMAGQLGGLASLAGVNLGQQQADKTTMALEILKSRAFITDFVERHEILPELMAAESWSPSNGLEYNAELYDAESRSWKTKDGKSLKPTSWQFVKSFRKQHLTVTRADDSGLVFVAINHLSPVVAQHWAKWLVEDINKTMRTRDIEEAERSLEYLNNELQRTSLSNMQQVFYQLIEKQTQTIMLANVRPEYIFQVIDPAVIPEQKAKPSRALICIVGTFLGGLMGLLIVFIRQAVRLK